MDSYKFDSSPKANPDSIVQGPNYRFTVLTDRLLRFEWSPDDKFEDRASTFAINRDFPTPKFSIKDNDDGVEIITDNFHLDYDRKYFSPSGLMASFNAKVTLWGSQWRFGETDARGNLGGTARTLDEVNGRCDMGEGVCSTLGYAAVDDSDSMLFDGEGFVTGRRPGAENGEKRIDGYLFAFGHDYRAAVKTLYQLSGKQPLLPRWGLGNWWSRFCRYDQMEYVGLMDNFKDHDIPLSVAVVDMDWHLVADDRVPHSGWTGYTWDDAVFPDPGQFGREIHSRNLKITLNDHPHSGIHHHEQSYEEMAKAIGHDTKDKTPILFDPTSRKFMEAYLSILHRNIEKVACDFWWIDWQQGKYSKVPGVDPLWVLNHFHMVDNCRDGNRGLIFSRYGGPGSHRYPVGFSGDTVTTWDSLVFQPEFTATASNVGYGWWSHDIGGHMMGTRDDELVTRWVQFGVLSPIMRLHSTDSQWASKEPWLYRKECEEAMAKYMRFRHRLIPYLYSMNVRAAKQDEPLIQPLYWHFPERKETYENKNEYCFGTELIVCPIVTKRDARTNLARVRAWLPPKAGRLVDIFSGTVYDGDRELNLYRRLSDMPVLAKEGSIVPLDAAEVPKNGGVNPEAFEVLVVIGRDGQASVLEDPADDDEEVKKQAPSSGERGSLIQYKQKEGTLTANVTGRTWSFRFLAVTEPPKGLKVKINDKDVTKDVKVTKHVYPETPSILVQCPVQPFEEKYSITIELGADPQLSIIDHKTRIKDYLLDYQTEFHIKDKLWSIVDDGGKGGVNVKMGKLMSLSVDETLTEPIAELVLADSRAMHL